MQKIIFTDLDGTLTLRDTYHIFIFHHLTVPLVLNNAFGLIKLGVGYIFGQINKEQVKRSSFKMFFSNYETTQNLDKFLTRIPWNKPVRDIVDAKQKEGYKVILVSASPDIYLPAITAHLGYDGFLATKTIRNNTKSEGQFDGKVCNFDEKTRRIREYLEDKKVEYTLSFGNSEGDYEMLDFCDESYFVKKANIKSFK